MGAVVGDPRQPATQSGMARGILSALDRGCDVVDLDTSLSGIRKWQCILTSASARRSRAAWMHRLHRGTCATQYRTRSLERQIDALGRRIDGCLLVRGTYSPLYIPYFPFLDTTLTEVEERWPDWLPWSRREVGVLRKQEAAYLLGAAHVFVTGRPSQRAVEAYGVATSRISVVGGGANLPAANSSIADQAGPVVLFVGRDFARKGGDVLLEAFRHVRAKVPRAILRIVGGDFDVSQTGVEMLGPIADREAMRRLYSEARVFTLPALFEPYGLVLLEAMACGVPCVGTEVGAIPDIIDDGVTGAVVPPGDPYALALALVAFLDDRSFAHRAGTAGLHKVREELNWARVANRLTGSMRQALEAKI